MPTGGKVTYVSYGDLEKIFVLTLSVNKLFKILSGKVLALALVTPWNTEGKLAAEEDIYMTSWKAKVVTEVQSLQAVVGLIEIRKRWGIIDRAPGIIQTQFVDEASGLGNVGGKDNLIS